MTGCIVNGCKNSSVKHNQDTKISFHSFPANPVLAARWTEKLRLNRNEPWWKPNKFTKICSIHFDDDLKYITERGMCRLRRNAVPTKELPVFCELNENLQVVEVVYQQEQPVTGEENDNLRNPDEPDLQGHSVFDNPNQQASGDEISGSDTDSAFDAPREALLRKRLNKLIVLRRSDCKKIKSLQEKVRRLEKKTASLQKIIDTSQNKDS